MGNSKVKDTEKRTSKKNAIIVNAEKVSKVKVSKNSKNKVKTGNEIEELFATVKNTKSIVESSKKKKETKMPNDTIEDDEFNDPRGTKNKGRLMTEDGHPVFTLEELDIGKGGDTPDCPFDCQCCF